MRVPPAVLQAARPAFAAFLATFARLVASALPPAFTPVLALALGPAAPADAQPRPEIGIVSGLVFPDEDVTGGGNGTSDFEPSLGIYAGLPRGDHWALFGEGLWSRFDSSRPDGDVSYVEARGGARVFPFGMAPRYALFAEVAAGWMRLDLANRVFAVDRPFASVGVGQRFHLGDRFALHWETRLSRTAADDGDPIQAGIGQPTVLIGLSVGLGEGQRDRDRDGITDRRDVCPDTPRGAQVDANGCPLDGDRDGVFDGLDRCPDTPRGVPIDSLGCSDTIDSDGDGVPDGIDRCPGTPADVSVDAWGCERAELLTLPLPRVLAGVRFEPGSVHLLEGSIEALDRAAQALQSFPEDHFEVAGHTDSSGDAAENRALSQRRAEMVRAQLIARGVSPARLTARGYGEEQPLADNGTEEGREANRRVELRRIDE
ncbi:MAG: OmpA family protein [Candidatus Eiseniibacteriota bacterium]